MKEYIKLLKSLNFATRRENVLSIKYPDIYKKILDFNSKHLNISFKQKVFNFINEIEEIPKCAVCENMVKFYNNKYSTYCSSKCQNSHDVVIEKSKVSRLNTMKSKWGAESTFLVPEIKEKIKNTLLDRYNTDHISKVHSVRKNLSISKKKKSIEKFLERDHINVISVDENRIMKISCDICNTNYDINYVTYLLRKKNCVQICTNCNPVNNYKSSILEKQLFDFISSHHINSIPNYKVGRYEIDIYLPDLKLGFEFNGLYWHSEQFKSSDYHLNKTNICNDLGINLFHIWEDDWLYKRNIVESMILNKIGKTSNRIFARKCRVVELENNEVIRNFLSENHIQGFIGSKIKLGLLYNDELVSIMTFGDLRMPLGQMSKSGSFELLRFCNKLNTSVIGGSSKLFNYFLRNFNFKEIISYSDYSRSDGNMYKKLNFNFHHTSPPNYYYVVDGIRRNRFGFRKDRLVKDGFDREKTEVQIMNERGYYRIFDCGVQKWIYKVK